MSLNSVLEISASLRILIFLFPVEISRFERISLGIRSCIRRCHESYWKHYCIQRWNFPINLQNQYSDNDYRDICRQLVEKKQIPYGKYSSNTVKFGYGRSSSLIGWLMVDHTTDGTVRTTSGKSFVNLHLCVQSVSSKTIVVFLKNLRYVSNFSSTEASDNCLSYYDCRIMSKHGILTDSLCVSTEVKLQLFNYFVARWSVELPLTDPPVENEPELLSILNRIELYSSENEVLLTINVVEEEKIWSSYQALPRGAYVVRSIASMNLIS
jgi:hypothetical protein